MPQRLRENTGEWPQELRCKYHGDQIADHETRMRALERMTWRATAYVSLAAAIFAALGGFLSGKVH